MGQEDSVCPKPNRGNKGAGKAPPVLQDGTAKELLRWTAPQQVKQEPGEGVLPGWDGPWQDFLKTVQSPLPGWGNTPLLATVPWEENCKAFVTPSEGSTDGWMWPRGDWVARPSAGETPHVSSGLEVRDQGDSGKLKEEILQAGPVSAEVQRRRFRQFCYLEAKTPREVCLRLRELCHQWLEPEKHTKEQILELVILEQFLTILPAEIQSWVRESGPGTCSQAVVLAEEYLMRHREAKKLDQQVSSFPRAGNWHPLLAKPYTCGIIL